MLYGGLFLISTILLGSLGEATGSNLSSVMQALYHYFGGFGNLITFILCCIFEALVTFFSLDLTLNFDALYMQSASLLCLPLTSNLSIGMILIVASASIFNQTDNPLPLAGKDKKSSTTEVNADKKPQSANILSSIEKVGNDANDSDDSITSNEAEKKEENCIKNKDLVGDEPNELEHSDVE